MKNWKRYLKGFLIGMMVEYLIRVNFNILTLVLVILFTTSVVVDILTTDFEKK